jgi:hypothetical protein
MGCLLAGCRKGEKIKSKPNKRKFPSVYKDNCIVNKYNRTRKGYRKCNSTRGKRTIKPGIIDFSIQFLFIAIISSLSLSQIVIFFLKFISPHDYS